MVEQASSHALDRRQLLRGAGVIGGAGAIAVVSGAVAPSANASENFNSAVLARVQSLGLVASVQETSSEYEDRPATTAPVIFMGAETPDGSGSTAGGTAAGVPGLDFWFKKA